MKKIRYGIIGVGSQGGYYARYLSGGMAAMGMAPTNACLGALCDIDPAKRTMCEIMYPETPFFSDYRELIASGSVDAIVTTVPHYFHTEMAIYALERTNKLYKQLRELVAGGSMGSIRRTNWIINSWWRPDSYYRQSAWRATWGGEGGGVLVNQAPHQLDLFQWICGIPCKVYANVRYGVGRDIVVDNDVTATLTYPNGATGVFITCTHDVIGTDRLEIDMDGGKIVVEDSKKATVYRLKKFENEMNATISTEEMSRLFMGGGADKVYDVEELANENGWGSQHGEVLRNFAEHLLTGEELLAPGSDGINGVNLCNAILLSSWLGREVELPVDEDIYLSELNKRIAAEGKYPTRG